MSPDRNLWLMEKGLLGGELGLELRQADVERRHRGSPEAQKFLDDLGRQGIDSQKVLKVLTGEHDPGVNVFELWSEWAMAEEVYYERQARIKRITALSREFKKMKGLQSRILNSPLFSAWFQNACRDEFAVIESALEDLSHENDSTISPPFTVSLFNPKQRHKGSDWSRHTFWSTIIVSLQTIWANAGKTDYRAFKDIARLFSLFFPPFPDDITVVKRRYYNSIRKSPNR